MWLLIEHDKVGFNTSYTIWRFHFRWYHRKPWRLLLDPRQVWFCTCPQDVFFVVTGKFGFGVLK